MGSAPSGGPALIDFNASAGTDTAAVEAWTGLGPRQQSTRRDVASPDQSDAPVCRCVLAAGLVGRAVSVGWADGFPTGSQSSPPACASHGARGVDADRLGIAGHGEADIPRGDDGGVERSVGWAGVGAARVEGARNGAADGLAVQVGAIVDQRRTHLAYAVGRLVTAAVGSAWPGQVGAVIDAQLLQLFARLAVQRRL